MRLLPILFLLFSLLSFSQNKTVSGIVYSKKTTAKYISITNLRTQTVKATDETGSFKISAQLNDTLVFSSMLYREQNLIIQPKHFKETVIVDLAPGPNALKTVNVSGVGRFKTQKYNVSLDERIKNDIAFNPQRYMSKDQLQGNLLGLVKLAIDLIFKNKNKNQSANFTPITYKEYTALFNSTKGVFNPQTLTNTLNISKTHQALFYDYCDAQQLDAKLLKPENEIILLDSLVAFSKSFKSIIENAKLSENNKLNQDRN